MKGRKHSLDTIFWGERPEDKTASQIIFNVLLGLGCGGLFFLVGWGISVLTEQAVVATFGTQFLQDTQEGAVDLTPLAFSPVGITVAIAGQFFLVGACEEFFFRGTIFRDLFPRRQKLGVAVSAGCFMLYHVFPGIVPWITFVVNWPYYFSLGILFALLVWVRHFNLVAPIVAHGTYNTILFVLIYLISGPIL